MTVLRIAGIVFVLWLLTVFGPDIWWLHQQRRQAEIVGAAQELIKQAAPKPTEKGEE